MKRLLSLLLIIAAIGVAACSAADKGAKISFTKTRHDFGTIKAKGGTVTCEFPFTNTGTEPLVIVSVTNGGCGCTTPDFPKEPIAPGKSGVIKIHFNPTGRSGELHRQVHVKTSAGGKRSKLEFTGVIVPN